MIQPINTNQNKYDYRNCVAYTVGTAVGLAYPAYIYYMKHRTITPKMLKQNKKTLSRISPDPDTFEHTKEVAEKVLEETGLKKRGVKIFYLDGTEKSLEKLKQMFFNSNIKDKKYLKNRFEQIKNGTNACYYPFHKTCIVNSKNLYGGIYHELGHAMVYNGNSLLKSALALRYRLTPKTIPIAAPLMLGIGLLHKPDKNKTKDKKDYIEKSLDFVSNHAAAITAASCIPMLTDEGLASIKGLKAAKKYLSKSVFQKTAMNYAILGGTYAEIALGATLGVQAGIWIANKIKQADKTK